MAFPERFEERRLAFNMGSTISQVGDLDFTEKEEWNSVSIHLFLFHDSGCHVTPDCGCHMTPDWGCHVTPDCGCHVTPGCGCHVTPGSGCQVTPGRGCHVTPGRGCHVTPDSGCRVTSCFLTVGAEWPATSRSCHHDQKAKINDLFCGGQVFCHSNKKINCDYKINSNKKINY